MGECHSKHNETGSERSRPERGDHEHLLHQRVHVADAPCNNNNKSWVVHVSNKMKKGEREEWTTEWKWGYGERNISRLQNWKTGRKPRVWQANKKVLRELMAEQNANNEFRQSSRRQGRERNNQTSSSKARLQGRKRAAKKHKTRNVTGHEQHSARKHAKLDRQHRIFVVTSHTTKSKLGWRKQSKQNARLWNQTMKGTEPKHT